MGKKKKMFWDEYVLMHNPHNFDPGWVLLREESHWHCSDLDGGLVVNEKSLLRNLWDPRLSIDIPVRMM